MSKSIKTAKKVNTKRSVAGKSKRKLPHAALVRTNVLQYIGLACFLVVFASLGVKLSNISHAASAWGTVSITVKGKKWCLDDRLGSTAPGNKVQIEPCSGASAQQWRYTSSGTIQNINGACLDPGTSASAGTTAVLQPCTTTMGANQLWYVNTSTHAVSNDATKLCLDVGRLVNGYPVKVYTCNKGVAQRWTVVAINPVASSPPMGFNDWYVYNSDITEQDILTQAQALVSSGMSSLGYNYVVIDDGWQSPTRRADGSIQANPATFPHGITWLADQVHAMGLELGIYTAYGPNTCTNHGSLPGSYGYYQEDANTFASWGIDFVKVDNCVHPPKAQDNPQALFSQLGAAIAKAPRRMVYSQELPVLVSTNINSSFNKTVSSSNAAQFLKDVVTSYSTANMWRVAPDFQATVGDGTFGDGNQQLMEHLANDLPLYEYAGAGHWNDLDMVLAGNSKFDEVLNTGTTQMSIWAELSSPLIVSTDLTNMSPTTRSLLTNKNVIAVDQHGGQAHLAKAYGSVDVITKGYPGGGYAVLVVNTSKTTQKVTFPVSITGATAKTTTFTDLWSGTTTEASGNFTQSLPAYGASLYRVQ